MNAPLRYHQALLDALIAVTDRLSRGMVTDESINEALARLGQSLEVDRVYVLRNTRGTGDTLSSYQAYRWCAPEAAHGAAAFRSLAFTGDGLARWQALFEQGKLLAVQADDLTESEQAFLAASGIQSMVLVPIHVHGEWWGLIGVDVFTGPCTWPPAELSVLRAVANVLGAALALQQLRSSEAQHRTLLDALPDTIFRFDRDGRYLFAMQPSGFVTAHSSEGIVGKTLVETLSPAAAAEALYHIRRALDTGEMQAFEYETTVGGKVYTREARTFPHEANEVLVIVRDLTEHRRIEEQFRQSEERWRQLVDNHPDPIIISVQSRIVYINQASVAIYGASTREDVLGRSIFDFIPEGLISVYQARANMIYQHGEATAPLAHWLIGLDGTRRFIEAFSVPVMYEGQRAAQTVLRDVTERQRYEAQLIQAKEQAEELNQLKTSFLANMSHEIRTPLTAILGFADLLVEEVGGESLEFAQLIRTSGQRLMDTLNSVLDLAQLEGRVRTLQSRPLDLGEQARQIMQLFRPKLELSNLSFRLELPDSGPVYVSLDQGALGRTLINLIENALKFTEEGTVTLSVWGDETMAYLSVSDTGVGISEAFMPYLFDEFKQESEGLDRHYEGSGLGLTITKRLVNLMGGDISVTSQKGQGSTFTLYFPRLPNHPAPTPEPSALPIDRFLDLAEPHLLLIEDNQDTIRLLRQLLPPTYRLDTARNVDDALVMAQATPYHAILMDINLGNVHKGIDALPLFRSLPGYAQTPLLACTAYALPGDKERLLEAGFNGYISKPFERPLLYQTLKTALADRFSS